MVDTKILCEIAKKAGDIIMTVYELVDLGLELKADNSPVTKADKLANDFIVEELTKIYADIPIISEESEIPPYEIRREWKHCFIVDPLDGTKEFLKKNGEFTVNIAYVQDGKTVDGVIYVPVTRDIYYTQAGASYKNGSIISGESSKRPYTILTSRSHLNQKTEDFIKEKRSKHPDLEIITVGSSLKLCMLAEGLADIYPRFAPTSEWDIAAGQAILEQASGHLLGCTKSEPLIYNKEDTINSFFIASL